MAYSTGTLAPTTSVIATAHADQMPPGVDVEPGGEPPVKRIDSQELRQLGQKLEFLFEQYRADRRIAELRWLRDERQYLGIYDPEIEKELSVNRSKAYPQVTRVKCISVLSRLMNLMFPGNERNWEIKASPSPEMDVKDVQQAVALAQSKDQEANPNGPPAKVDDDYIKSAVQTLADSRAEALSTLIDDQLEELGGDQSRDYIGLNRAVLKSGILYGLGILRGPFTEECKQAVWSVGPDGTPQVKSQTRYKPRFEFLKLWDFYPDMSAKSFIEMDGYFTRVVMSRAQIRALCDREDFMSDQIKQYLTDHQMGNYRPQPYEIELRAMGVKVNVNEMKTETSKYEVIVWHGQTSGAFLSMAGVDVPKGKLADDLDAEIWLIDGNVIKCALDPWASLGVKVKTIHTFLFDEDDTSPVGFGLPNAVRDSQMSIAACTRMLLDNASVTCGPNIELNTELLRPDQDLRSISSYKIWYRNDDGPSSQYPAVRNIPIDAHLDELTKLIDLFMKFADAETFVGPATGGDMEKMASEPMRTAAGASMLRADSALPFKDIVRSFDSFTQSVLLALVMFNKKFNPDKAREGDYNVLARGATSLIAKEVRGLQIDQLAMSLQPDEKLHVDMRKLARQRLLVRDMGDLLVSEEEADRRQSAQDQASAQQQQQQTEMIQANIRKILSDGFKNVTQAQKNSAAADADAVQTALDLLERGLMSAMGGTNGGTDGSAGGNPGPSGAGATPADTGQPAPPGPGAPSDDGTNGTVPGQDQGPPGPMPGP